MSSSPWHAATLIESLKNAMTIMMTVVGMVMIVV